MFRAAQKIEIIKLDFYSDKTSSRGGQDWGKVELREK